MFSSLLMLRCWITPVAVLTTHGTRYTGARDRASVSREVHGKGRFRLRRGTHHTLFTFCAAHSSTQQLSLHTFFLAEYYLYSFACILPGPSIFLRMFSNIENTFVTQQVDGGPTLCSKLEGGAPKPPGNVQSLKISGGIVQKATAGGKKSCFGTA